VLAFFNTTFLPCSVNIFRLEIGASLFLNTMHHESTYHDFLPCSVNIFGLEIGAGFFSIPGINVPRFFAL